MNWIIEVLWIGMPNIMIDFGVKQANIQRKKAGSHGFVLWIWTMHPRYELEFSKHFVQLWEKTKRCHKLLDLLYISSPVPDHIISSSFLACTVNECLYIAYCFRLN